MRFLIVVLFLVVPKTLSSQNTFDRVAQYIQGKNYREAEALLEKKLEATDDPNLKDKLGEVYSYLGKWDDAISLYKNLTEVAPQNASYFFRYGGVLAKKAQNSSKFVAFTLLRKIKDSFKKAILLDPKHIEAHWALVDLYVSLPGIVGGSTSKAYTYAHSLRSLSAIDGYLALGYVLEYDDKPEQAKEKYLKALELIDQMDAIDRNQLHYQIGKISGDYGLRLDEGIHHMSQYIKNYRLTDGVPLKWAYYRMAKLHRQKGNKAVAQNWISKSLKIDSEFQAAKKEQKSIIQME